MIKLRSFPISLLNIIDSEVVLGFYQQFQSTLLYMKSIENIFYGFDVFHSLNSTKEKFSDIVSNLLNIDQISYDNYAFLNQLNENLVNFQNVLEMAFRIEKDCNCLLEMEKSLNKKQIL